MNPLQEKEFLEINGKINRIFIYYFCFILFKTWIVFLERSQNKIKKAKEKKRKGRI